jgi:glycosyltransferase involved in cell wall biosynthesis
MRVCIISDTFVTQEPRVLRQIRTFQERGWAVSVAGYPGVLPVPADWDFHDLTLPALADVASPPTLEPERAQASVPEPAPAAGRTLPGFLGRAPANALQRVASFLFWRILMPAWRSLPGREGPIVAPTASPAAPPASTDATPEASAFDPGALVADLLALPAARRISLEEAMAIFNREPKHVYFRDVLAPAFPKADLVVAHDYHTLPLAEAVARRWGSPIVMDIHEYAVEQYLFAPGTPERRYFENVTRPMIDAFHRHYLPRLRGVSCVCDGIARQVAADYELARVPTVVRSTTFYSAQPFRPAGRPITVMYHGLVNATRHLEVGVRSLALWRPEFRLVIRGPGPESYVVGLKALAEELGVADRLLIEPPVPFQELVSVANAADIGYLAFMNYSRQRQFASPNKFFEYIMAGLALAVMDVPELAPVVRRHRLGEVIADFTPEAIASCINSFDAARIDACKQASLALARKLCWEREQDNMVSAYGLAELETQAASGR